MLKATRYIWNYIILYYNAEVKDFWLGEIAATSKPADDSKVITTQYGLRLHTLSPVTPAQSRVTERGPTPQDDEEMLQLKCP